MILLLAALMFYSPYWIFFWECTISVNISLRYVFFFGIYQNSSISYRISHSFIGSVIHSILNCYGCSFFSWFSETQQKDIMDDIHDEVCFSFLLFLGRLFQKTYANVNWGIKFFVLSIYLNSSIEVINASL